LELQDIAAAKPAASAVPGATAAAAPSPVVPLDGFEAMFAKGGESNSDEPPASASRVDAPPSDMPF
jgi:hypothetical protein